MGIKVEDNKHKSIKQREQLEGYLEDNAEDAAVDYPFEEEPKKKQSKNQSMDEFDDWPM